MYGFLVCPKIGTEFPKNAYNILNDHGS